MKTLADLKTKRLAELLAQYKTNAKHVVECEEHGLECEVIGAERTLAQTEHELVLYLSNEGF